MDPNYKPKKRPPASRGGISQELGEINVSLIELLQDHPDLAPELAPILSRLQQAANRIRGLQEERIAERRRRSEEHRDMMIRESSTDFHAHVSPREHLADRPQREITAHFSPAPPPPSLFDRNQANTLSYETTAKSIQERDRSTGRIRLQISLDDYRKVTQALERQPDPTSFTAKELQQATQSDQEARLVPMTQLYLVLRFWRDAGVIERAGGRKFTVATGIMHKGIAVAAQQALLNPNPPTE